MKQLLLSFLLIFSVGLMQANDNNIIVKKMIVTSDQEDKNVDVNVKVENEQLTLTIKKDGNENVYTVNLKDEEAFEALVEELENLDIDVNIMDLKGLDNDHQMKCTADDKHYDGHFDKEGGGYLGVQIQDISDQLRDYFKVAGDGGVLVTEVVKNSPAEKARLEAGDIITRVNDVRISDAGELTRTIRKETPETEVDITVVRKGREKLLKTTLGSSGDSFSWFGNMGDRHKKSMKKHKKMMKKFDHKCTDACGDNCPLKGQMKMDFNVVIPDRVTDMMKNKIFMQKCNLDDEFEKLKKEIEELREEIQKLKE